MDGASIFMYPVYIPRCTHIKTNGTQCGSPALRGRRFCFFHKNWQGQRIQLNAKLADNFSFTLPVLEDADSVQVALMQVMRLILSGQLEAGRQASSSTPCKLPPSTCAR